VLWLLRERRDFSPLSWSVLSIVPALALFRFTFDHSPPLFAIVILHKKFKFFIIFLAYILTLI